MIAMAVLKVGENRGAPRVWVSCENARRAGFEPGQRFVVQHSGKGLLIKLDTEGERVVSQKKRGERTVPVIDINSKETLSPVAGCEVVRVVFGKGQIYVSALASELRRQERLERESKASRRPGRLSGTGGIALGGGIVAHAVHQGIKDAGLTPHALVANEIREELVNHALVHNDSLSQYTVVLNAPLQEVAFDDEVLKRLQPVDLVDCGIPCSGASVAGKARNKNAMMEDHEHVGHLIAAAIALLVKLNPVCIVWENVTQYSSTASAAILRASSLASSAMTCRSGNFWGLTGGSSKRGSVGASLQ